MRQVCKHGLPISWNIDAPEWRGHSLLQTVTVHCCRQCIKDGTAATIAQWVESWTDKRLDGQLTSGDKS